MGFLNRFVGCVLFRCVVRVPRICIMFCSFLCLPIPCDAFHCCEFSFVPFLFAILRCLLFVVLLSFEIIRKAFRLCSTCRFILFSGSPSILFKFILKQLIGFETIIEKKELAIVSSGSECVPRRKWVNRLVVGFVVQEITSVKLKSFVQPLLSRFLSLPKGQFLI